jgi:predicted acylesterase/phospholipase RssA
MRRFPVLLIVALTLALGACTGVSIVRSPVAEVEIDTAAPMGVQAPFLRFWGDDLDRETGEAILAAWSQHIAEGHAEDIAQGRPVTSDILAVSGGGPDGAFAAGLMQGWTARGDRPTFDMVTGISTGAIVALFAFLGPDYDPVLREIYTTHKTDDLLVPALFHAIMGGLSLADTAGYDALIEQYLTDAVVARLGEEYGKGRSLLIGTTNLDAARPVVWNIGAIAASGHPRARRLIGEVIRASSAIPGVFPPVIIPVITADGLSRDEMHVDGAVTQRVMFFNPMFPLRRIDETLGLPVERTLHVIVNNQLRIPYKPVKTSLLDIAQASASGLLRGAGGGDIYKILATSQRDGVTLRVVSIPVDFEDEAQEAFDPVYMGKLFDLGHAFGLGGDHWIPHPPDYQPWTPSEETPAPSAPAPISPATIPLRSVAAPVS